MRRTQVTAHHQIQAHIETGLSRIQTVGHHQEEAPATLALSWGQRQSRGYVGPDKVHFRAGAAGELSSAGLSLDVPEGEGK